MAENLNYDAEGSKCYDDKPANCVKYGRLYNRDMAMKACPEGWRLPNNLELNILDDFANSGGGGSDKNTGKKLKAKNGWDKIGNKSGNGTDNYGFSALPGGWQGKDGRGSDGFFQVGKLGNWWKEGELDQYERAGSLVMYHEYDCSGNGTYKSDFMLSVRCLQGSREEVTAARAALKSGVQRSTFTDARDNKTYKAVKIGEQTWMAENLNYDAKGSKCYGEGEKVSAYDKDQKKSITITLSDAEAQANCAKYGRLYDWATAMGLPSSCYESQCQIWFKHKGICPSGWHIPNNADWDALITAAGGRRNLMATSGWDIGNGTDRYGFSALPGGGYSLYYGFVEGGRSGGWWSASEGDCCSYYSDRGAYDFLYISYGNNFRYSSIDYCLVSLNSVRCVQD